MKKLLFVLIALLAVFAFAAAAVAAEKKAPAPQAGKVSGKVTVYIAANQTDKSAPPGTIAVKDAKDKNWTFDVLPETKITGEVKRDAQVTVAWKKEGGKTTATSITVAAVKKPAAPKPK